MSRGSAQLEARREMLVARSACLRARLADDAAAMADRVRLVDSAAAFVRSGTGRVVLFGGAALVLLAGPGRALRIAGRILVLWPLVRPWLPRVIGFIRQPNDMPAGAEAWPLGDA